ncbi:MAG: hypothetical protein IPQ06_08740 [Chitinophagaceae bacterium]|nr:hypothetical protein [Chitinophagaceae bacterium]MBL0273143.1 hypothetical protein [Chitinophagaceae bacterium]
MKIILSFTLSLLCIFTGHSQSLKKYPISNSGCSLYIYCEPKFSVEKSTDSSLVFTGECVKDDISYGVVCVKLLNPVSDLTMAEDLLISYLDYLKENFNIINAAGYGKGHRLNNKENTRGILDYWEDKDKDKWKIKAWTDGKYIGFIYAYSKKELPEAKVNIFLDSFRLPGM